MPVQHDVDGSMSSGLMQNIENNPMHSSQVSGNKRLSYCRESNVFVTIIHLRILNDL